MSHPFGIRTDLFCFRPEARNLAPPVEWSRVSYYTILSSRLVSAVLRMHFFLLISCTCAAPLERAVEYLPSTLSFYGNPPALPSSVQHSFPSLQFFDLFFFPFFGASVNSFLILGSVVCFLPSTCFSRFSLRNPSVPGRRRHAPRFPSYLPIVPPPCSLPLQGDGIPSRLPNIPRPRSPFFFSKECHASLSATFLAPITP